MERTDQIYIHGFKAWLNFLVFLSGPLFYESQYSEKIMGRSENYHGSSLVPKNGNGKDSLK